MDPLLPSGLGIPAMNTGLLSNALFAAVVVFSLVVLRDNYLEAWVLAIGSLTLGTNAAGWYLTGNPFIGFITLVVIPLVIVVTLGLVYVRGVVRSRLD